MLVCFSAYIFIASDPADVFVFTELPSLASQRGPKKESSPGIKKCLALARNGGLNHLLKIFNDISVFLV